MNNQLIVLQSIRDAKLQVLNATGSIQRYEALERLLTLLGCLDLDKVIAGLENNQQLAELIISDLKGVA